MRSGKDHFNTTKSQNGINKRTQSNNKSGVVGVSWEERRKVWTARIVIEGKATNLGIFKEFEKAVAARKKAEEIYYGEFSPR